MTDVRSKNWTVTINYYDEVDIEDLEDALADAQYSCFSIEGYGCSQHHMHIHVYLHYTNARTFTTIKNKFTKQHHIEVVKDPPSMIKYCMGYKDGHLKCDQCEIIFFESGDKPAENGKNKSGDQVIQAINDGMTIDELRIKYPSYILHHEPKVKAYIDAIKPKVRTEFCVINPIDDAITEIYEALPNLPNVAVVTELQQLEAYPNYDTVIYYTDYFDKLHELWPRGVPITYKYGYQIKTVKCSTFIIVTNDLHRYPLYKKL